MPYRHGLRVKKYKRGNTWRYDPVHHTERRNPFRRSRRYLQRTIQTTSRDFFRYHFVLPTNKPLKSLQEHEIPDQKHDLNSFALVINTPEATDTASARIFSVIILDKKDLCPKITADIA